MVRNPRRSADDRFCTGSATTSHLRTSDQGTLTWANVGSHGLKYQGSMLYFFDTRDNGTFIEDDVGLELADLDAVKTQAALSLTELARDVLPDSIKRVLSVEVRDAFRPILKDVLTFEAIVLAN